MNFKLKIKNPNVAAEMMEALSHGVFSFNDPGPEGERDWKPGDPVQLDNDQRLRVNELRQEARDSSEAPMSGVEYADWIGGRKNIPPDIAGVPGEPIVATDLTRPEVAILGLEALGELKLIQKRSKARAKSRFEQAQAAEAAAQAADRDEIKGR